MEKTAILEREIVDCIDALFAYKRLSVIYICVYKYMHHLDKKKKKKLLKSFLLFFFFVTENFSNYFFV